MNDNNFLIQIIAKLSNNHKQKYMHVAAKICMFTKQPQRTIPVKGILYFRSCFCLYF